MTEWEHTTREVASGNRDAELRDMGKQGWELVGTADNGWTLFFKRPKPRDGEKPDFPGNHGSHYRGKY